MSFLSTYFCISGRVERTQITFYVLAVGESYIKEALGSAALYFILPYITILTIHLSVQPWRLVVKCLEARRQLFSPFTWPYGLSSISTRK